jgi:RHS repeat-associated protein
MTDMEDGSGCSLGEINPFRYRGYYYDEDTGWYYLQSRYYDAEVGRFLNADDVHYLGDETLSCNLFTYCANNPVNYSDFNGYLTVDQVLSKVANFAAYVISWFALVGGRKTQIVSLALAGGSIALGVVQYVKDWRGYYKKNKTQLRISTFSFALCLIGNVITIVLARYSLTKCKSAIKAFLWFIGTSLSMSLAAYAWVYDLAFASKNSYSWLKKQVRRHI